jgi:hypothetical protein
MFAYKSRYKRQISQKNEFSDARVQESELARNPTQLLVEKF